MLLWLLAAVVEVRFQWHRKASHKHHHSLDSRTEGEPGEKYFNIQNAKLAIKTWRACRLKQSATGGGVAKTTSPAADVDEAERTLLRRLRARTAAAPAAPWLAFRLLPFCVTEIVKKKKKQQKRRNSIQEGKESARKKKNS